MALDQFLGHIVGSTQAQDIRFEPRSKAVKKTLESALVTVFADRDQETIHEGGVIRHSETLAFTPP